MLSCGGGIKEAGGPKQNRSHQITEKNGETETRRKTKEQATAETTTETNKTTRTNAKRKNWEIMIFFE